MLIPALILVAGLALTQGLPAVNLPPVSVATDYAHLTRAMTAPTLTHSTDPAYTQQALTFQIEGTVVLQAIIGINGRVTHASVLSPLPEGLDQSALSAVEHWRYVPGSMDTVTIPVLTTIDVLFRLPYQSSRRPAVPPMPADPVQAALAGNVSDQYELGVKYEQAGNLREAKRFFRLCASAVDARCQYRLGRLLVSGPDVNPNDFAQGVAWLELAKEHGNREAAAVLDSSKAKLSSVQQDWVEFLKPHLERRKR